MAKKSTMKTKMPKVRAGKKGVKKSKSGLKGTKTPKPMMGGNY